MVHLGLMGIHRVQGPYEVQCFFIARNGKGKGEVYDIQRQVSDLPTDGAFYAPDYLEATAPSTLQRGTGSGAKKENGRTFPPPLCEAFTDGSVGWLRGRFSPTEEEFCIFWQARQPLSSQSASEYPREEERPAVVHGPSLRDGAHLLDLTADLGDRLSDAVAFFVKNADSDRAEVAAYW